MLQFRTVGKDERMYHMGKFEKKKCLSSSSVAVLVSLVGALLGKCVCRVEGMSL
jgi:hypothetical protein